VERGKQHLKADELRDAMLCFGRARELDKNNKEATRLWNETVRVLIDRERNLQKDAQLEQVRQMLLQRLATAKTAKQ
jgi:argonaute-like protein implicated in RNA metabolism and viral defense